VYNEHVSERNNENEADALGIRAKLLEKFRKGPMPKFERHIFICTNQRPEGHLRGCCNPSGEGDLHRAFKAKLSERGIPNTKVRANKAGCLDQCELGPTVVVYPEAVWYGHVAPADVDEIIDSHIVGGKPVQRLIIPDSLLNNTQQLGAADKSSERGVAKRKE
jgi:(2Fe-2S) ferredoxin